MSETKDQITRKAGRGFLFILGAKLYFLVAGYAIVVLLSHILERSLYGFYGIVIGAISVLDNVIVTGTIQTVSRFTAEGEARAGQVKAAALKLQLMLGGGVAVSFALAAPWIAEFERDPALTPYLRLAAGVVFFYAFYSVFVGSANGQKRFGVQAGLDALYATIRGALILGLASAFAVWGGVSGFVVASGLILVISVFVVGVRDVEGGYPIRTLARFIFPVMGYLLLVNLIMFTDLFLLKRLAAEALAGLADGAEAAEQETGVYVAVQQLARITYQALLAVTFVIFPIVSRSTFDDDEDATRSYITSTMRYSLILTAALAAIMTALPSQVMGFPFSPDYQTGNAALAVLAPGYGAFAMFVVATTILNAAGRTRWALLIAAVVLTAAASASSILIPLASTREELLLYAAASAAGSMGLGWFLSVAVLRGVFGAPVGWLTIIRVGVAFAGAVAVGHYLPVASRMMTLVECAVVGVVFGALLLLTGELNRADLSRILVVVRRKKS